MIRSVSILVVLAALPLAVTESFGDDLSIRQDCTASVITISVHDEEGEPVSSAQVQVYQDRRASSKLVESLKTDGNGTASFDYTEETASVKVLRSGFNPETLFLQCDDVVKVEPAAARPTVPDTAHCEVLINAEFGSREIYGGEQQEAFSDPVCKDFLRELQHFSKLADDIIASPHVPDWIKSLALWWASGDIDHSEFIKAVKYLISKEIILIPLDEMEHMQNRNNFPYGQEKEYSGPMNVIGKTVRIFDDRICVEEYCSYQDTLKVSIEGNVGMNTREQIEVALCFIASGSSERCHIKNLITGGSGSGDTPGLSAVNKGGGDFEAEWTIRGYTQSGWYYAFGIVDGRPISAIADTMHDAISGNFNHQITVLNYR